MRRPALQSGQTKFVSHCIALSLQDVLPRLTITAPQYLQWVVFMI